MYVYAYMNMYYVQINWDVCCCGLQCVPQKRYVEVITPSACECDRSQVQARCEKMEKRELTKSDFYGSSGFIKLECSVLFINELAPYALTVLVNS